MSVTVDSSRAAAMLDRIAQRASGNLTPALERAADPATVTGIPVDTGKLAGSITVRVQGDEAQVISDVPYARFVFRGTRYMSARPPTVNAGALAQQAAQEIASEVIR
jgi:hypothetical protein